MITNVFSILIINNIYCQKPSVQFKMTSEELSNIKAVYITVGEKESGTMLKVFADLRNCLEKKNIPSLEVTSHIIIDEDHRSAALPSYYNAFKYLYKKE